MSEEFLPGRGLDIGTSFIISSREYKEGGKVMYTEFRDAFLKLKPSSPIAKKMMAKGLKGQQYFEDVDGSYIVVGQDAIERAIERNISASRPLVRGVISPKEKQARRILRHIFKEILATPLSEGEKVVYSVPAQPVDQFAEEFDVGFHTDALNNDIRALGFTPSPLSEGEAVCYSELENDNYNGIGISCLTPDTKIYTDHGILPIEKVKEGYKVITHKGQWKPILKVITKSFNGLSTKLQLQGYSDNCNDYRFVDNHELYVKRNGNWQWIGCEEIEIGDQVGEPILQENLTECGLPHMTICEHITSSKKYTKKSIGLYSDVCRLIGYFLGDGSVSLAEGCIQFDFNKNESFYANDIKEIIEKNFNKNSTIIELEDKLRLKCYSASLANYFKNHFYNENQEKVFPWSLNRLNRGHCLNLLTGLVRSDGCISNQNISFANTSTSLILLAKQCFSRIGIAASLSYREPRPGGFIKGRQIQGKKQEWEVNTRSKVVSQSVIGFIETATCETSKFAERLFIDNQFCCSRVQKIEYENYEGIVYDLQIEEDHSFSGPFLTIHNCGAGMVNICLMSSGEGILHFSVTRSGDWIDRMAAQATAQPDTVVQVEKEGSSFVIGQEIPSNPILSAVSLYYVRLIDYVIQHLIARILKAENLPKFTEPLPIIIAGGTSQAQGFVDQFRSILEEKNKGDNSLPFQVKEVRAASNPLRAVSRGCLLASQL